VVDGEPTTRQWLRDWTGELRRPRSQFEARYHHLLRDDGRLDREEQLRIMQLLLPPQHRAATLRFMLMITLSVTIAVMGLAADSAAVVIGAMLIAPLMGPIMTFSAAVGLGLGRRAAQAAILVAISSIWSVLFSIFLARLLPTVTIGSEVLARTRPDVRDLIVAVAAGAAGAYATARQDVSAALPGVAVAVALVPPLAATGVLIDADQMVLAEGSALLYLTNLFAIIVSALIVFLATGVVPTLRLLFQSPRIAMTTAGILVVMSLIAFPLTTRSLDAAESSKLQADVASTVETWVGELSLDIETVEVEGTTVTVELTGLEEPPHAYDLATQLVPILGDDAAAIVRWDQRAQGQARADTEPAADPALVARQVIENWIAGLAADGVVLELVDLTYGGDTVDATVSGPAAPPRAPTLSDEVADAIGADVLLDLRWIPSFDPGLGGEPPAERLDRFVTTWIGDRSSVRLIATSIDGSTLFVDLGADGTPAGLGALERVALDAVDGAVRVEVRLLPLEVVGIAPDEFDVPRLD